MARPLRVEIPGGFYHVTSRGVARQDIFFEKRDRNVFFTKLAEVHKRWGLVFHAYCLMTNHYHLEVETPEGYLSRPIQWLNQEYATYVNRTYNRTGHLFQGRFKGILVEAESHLHELTRYIHMNPCHPGMAEHPADYPWSSYRTYLALRKCPPWLNVATTLKRFGRSKSDQIRRYRRFVEQSTPQNPLRDLAFGAVLGSEAFVQRIRTLLRDRGEDPEVSALGRAQSEDLDLPKICAVVAAEYGVSEAVCRSKGRKRNECRDIAIHLARSHRSSSLQALGEYFGGIRPSAICHATRRIEMKIHENRRFSAKVKRLCTRVRDQS